MRPSTNSHSAAGIALQKLAVSPYACRHGQGSDGGSEEAGFSRSDNAEADGYHRLGPWERTVACTEHAASGHVSVVRC